MREMVFVGYYSGADVFCASCFTNPDECECSIDERDVRGVCQVGCASDPILPFMVEAQASAADSVFAHCKGCGCCLDHLCEKVA